MKKPRPDQPLSPLRKIQCQFATGVTQPLTRGDRMRRRWTDGRLASHVVSTFIKPNDALSSLERLEIYNRQYWFRLLDSLREDFPGLRGVLGERRFRNLCVEYVHSYPSVSYTLRDLGARLFQFIIEHPELTAPKTEMARDMANLEWAQIEVFDAGARPILTANDIRRNVAVRLQPYLRFFEFDHAVDQLLKTPNRRSLWRPQKTHLAVHRIDFACYFKRLEPSAFRILKGLQEGVPLEDACGLVDESIQPGTVQEWFQHWMALGWFCK